MKDPKRKKDVLIAPMLCDAKQKLLPVPRRQRTLRGDERTGVDAIWNCRGLLHHRTGCVLLQTPKSAFGDARNGVRGVQALLQNQPVEQDFGESEVARDVIRVEIMKSHYGRAMIRMLFQTRRIR